MTTEDLVDELRAALLAEHDDHHPIAFAEGCGCETCQLLLRVWEHDHSVPPAVGATRDDRGRPERWNGSEWADLSSDPTDVNEWADHLLWLSQQLRDNDRDVEFVWLAEDGVAPTWTLVDQLELAARNIRTSVPEGSSNTGEVTDD